MKVKVEYDGGKGPLVYGSVDYSESFADGLDLETAKGLQHIYGPEFRILYDEEGNPIPAEARALAATSVAESAEIEIAPVPKPAAVEPPKAKKKGAKK